MSLTCYCPRCATAFLVSEQQLGEAQGWVRCGICQEVFMAKAHTVAPPQTLVTDPPGPHRQEAPPLEEPRLKEESFYESTPPMDPEAPKQPVPYKAKKRSKGLWGWILVGLLATLLISQIGWHQRNFLANAAPKVTSWFQSLCPVGHCGLKKLAAISIDDASFRSAGTNLFHLQAVIGNRSELALDAPMLSLTLTDPSDRVLAQSNFPPREWGAADSILPASSAMPLSLWIEWNGPLSGTRVVGYRLHALYP